MWVIAAGTDGESLEGVGDVGRLIRRMSVPLIWTDEARDLMGVEKLPTYLLTLAHPGIVFGGRGERVGEYGLAASVCPRLCRGDGRQSDDAECLAGLAGLACVPSSTTPVANANNATNKPNPNPNTDRVNRAAEDAKHDALTAVQLREHLLESFPHLTSTGSSARSTLTRFDRRARGQGTAAAGPRRLDCHGFACAWQEYRGSSTRSHGCARVARPLRHRLPMVGNATDYVSPPPASTGARRQSWYETGAKYKRRADAAVLARPPKRVRFDQTHKKNGGSSGYLRTIKEGSESSNTIDGDYVDEPRNKE
ncbi:hypothetical protein IWX46DRAFT_583883 [Phyllosticta citricarpa]|uniref:Uncharacterized protein n=1 Tax=Phyllosticta citricarpa TaxID=55181 RepID=A0ABR1LMR8_9PEZI